MVTRGLVIVTAVVLGVLTLGSCGSDVDRPAFQVIEPGTGPEVTPSFDWLRPGYLAIAPDVAVPLDPGFGARTSASMQTLGAMRAVRTPSGVGVVLSGQGPELVTLRWSWLVEATPDGLVVRRAAGVVLDPPWLLLPAKVKDGMQWSVKDAGGHVLGTGTVAVRQEVHPSLGEVTTLTVDFDVDRQRGPDDAESLEERVPWFDSTFNDKHTTNTPSWRRAILRETVQHPCLVGGWIGQLVAHNPLTPDGRPLRWRFLADRGFWAESALVPTEARPLVPEALSAKRSLTPLVMAPHLVSSPWQNIVNVTRVVGDPRGGSVPPDRLDVSGIQWSPHRPVYADATGGIPAEGCGPEATWGEHRLVGFRASVKVDADGLGIDPTKNMGDGLPFGDATHFELDAAGNAGLAPTLLGYALEDRVHPYAIPPQQVMNPDVTTDSAFLHGTFLGVFRDADGAVRGLVNRRVPGPGDGYGPTTSAAAGSITHEAPVASRPEDRDFRAGLDPDYPAVGHIYMRVVPPPWLATSDDPGFVDMTGTRVVPPPISQIHRVAVLAPEVAGRPTPLFIDAFPWVGLGAIERALLPGTRATAAITPAELAGYFPEPLTVVRDAEGRRQVFAVTYAGAIRELDASGPHLRWRSLGVPDVPAGHVVVAAWREGARLRLITQRGVAKPAWQTIAGGYQGDVYSSTLLETAEPAAWQMPIDEGPWEDFPATLFTGVDVDGPDGEGRVVCAPPGKTLAADTVGLLGQSDTGPASIPTRRLDVDARCVVALADQATRDLEGLIRDGPIGLATAGVTFTHPALGAVLAYGEHRLTELGGRLRVPRATWDALVPPSQLAPASLPELASLASPLPDAAINAFAVDFSTAPEATGGTWIVPRDRTCRDATSCFDVHLLRPGLPPRTVTVPSDIGASIPTASVLLPASDEGLYLWSIYISTDGIVTDAPRSGDTLGQYPLIDPLGGISSPSGPRPPPGLDDRIFGGEAHAPPPPGLVMGGFMLPYWNGRETVYERPGLDVWHGVRRDETLPEAMSRLFTRFGAPLPADTATLGAPDGPITVIAAPGRRTYVRHRDDGVTLFGTYATDVFGRAVELLHAGATRGALPDPRLLPAPTCGCDPDTEACVDGACVCAPEHRRQGGACVPILGGSYLPAPSCAAIRDREGHAPQPPAVAFIDPDGTGSRRLDASPTVRAACPADGLTERLDVEPGRELEPLDLIYGAFRVDGATASGPPALYRARPPGDAWDEPRFVALRRDPLVAVLVDGHGTGTLQVALRVRSEHISLGTWPESGDLADLSLTRDASHRLCARRAGVELACREVPDSPLFLIPRLYQLPPGVAPQRFATEGLRCPERGHDYGAGLCACTSRSCEQAAHECGTSDDGCFGPQSCGACVVGAVCAYERCECVPDAFEEGDDPRTDHYELEVGVDGAPFTNHADGFTLDRADDVDWIAIVAGDAGFRLPNELVVTLRSDSDTPLDLVVGTSGCATSCVVGEPVSLPFPMSPANAPGCRASGVGEVSVTFRVACDPFTPDAEAGTYYARVSAEPTRADACLIYGLEATSRASP